MSIIAIGVASQRYSRQIGIGRRAAYFRIYRAYDKGIIEGVQPYPHASIQLNRESFEKFCGGNDGNLDP